MVCTRKRQIPLVVTLTMNFARKPKKNYTNRKYSWFRTDVFGESSDLDKKISMTNINPDLLYNQQPDNDYVTNA